MTTTRVNGFASGAAAAVAALALAACSSPPARFYTLSPADAAAPLRTAPANPAFLIEVPAVGVPEQVAKSQLVVQKNAAQVDVLEQERWASPPADEIRRALSDDLAAQLGTIDVANSAYPPGVPVYRISVNVQRFESWPARRAAVDAVERALARHAGRDDVPHECRGTRCRRLRRARRRPPARTRRDCHASRGRRARDGRATRHCGCHGARCRQQDGRRAGRAVPGQPDLRRRRRRNGQVRRVSRQGEGEHSAAGSPARFRAA